MTEDNKTSEHTTAFRVPRRTFFVFQFGAVTALMALAGARKIYTTIYGNDLLELMTRAFDLNLENSFPTWFSMLNLMIASALLFVIYRHAKAERDSKTLYWLCLSVLFFALSAEEIVGMHERATKFQAVTGVLVPVIQSNSWLLYGALFTVLAFVFFAPFLLKLDRRTAGLFLLAGGIYLSGALGFEFLQASLTYSRHGTGEGSAAWLYMVLEEGGEMYGIALFNCILFSRIRAQNMQFTIETTQLDS